MGIYLHSIELPDGTIVASAVTTSKNAPEHDVTVHLPEGRANRGPLPLSDKPQARGIRSVWTATVPEGARLEVHSVESLFDEDADLEGWARVLGS